MQDAFTFVISTLFDMYTVAMVLRLALQWVRADFRNPLAQFILKATNPLILPTRRVVPAIGGLDTATLLVVLAVAALGTVLLVQIACVGSVNAGQIAVLTLLRLVHLVLRTWSLLILAYVILSWVGSGSYNPAANLLAVLVEPLLAPLRRLIPTIGGLDISPVFALLALEFLNRLLPSGFQAAGLMCLPF